VDLAKALEVQANLVVRQGLAGEPAKRRRANIDGATRDVAVGPALSLGQLGRVLAEERELAQAVAGRLRDGEWLVRQGAYVLSDIARHRNPAAHSEPVSRAEAERIRNQLLGIGCYGELVRLAGVRPKSSA
jgi:hypothetical protein